VSIRRVFGLSDHLIYSADTS